MLSTNLSPEIINMRERLWRTAIKYLVVLFIGLAYLAFVLITGWGLPCPLYMMTGLQCPSCGISRMLVSLFKLDFAAAFSYNPYMLFAVPLVLGLLAIYEIRYIKSGERSMGRWGIALWVIVIGAIAFGILRNIFQP